MEGALPGGELEAPGSGGLFEGDDLLGLKVSSALWA